MSVWIHGFSGSESITISTYFDAQNVPDLVGDWELLQVGLCAFFWIYHVILWAHYYYNYFGEGTRIHSNGTRWSSLTWTLSALGLDWTLSLKNPGSLVGVILGPKIWKLGVLISTKLSWLVTVFSVDRWGNSRVVSFLPLFVLYL